MVGDHARLVVARHLARRARMDRQLRAHRRRRLVAKPRAMADRGDLRRRPPARPRDPDARRGAWRAPPEPQNRSEEHTSELQSLMRISYDVFCLKKKNHIINSIIS